MFGWTELWGEYQMTHLKFLQNGASENMDHLGLPHLQRSKFCPSHFVSLLHPKKPAHTLHKAI